MKAGKGPDKEQVSVHRDGALPGVEVRIIGDSERAWSYYSTAFEFLAPASWSGDVRHRGETSLLAPGSVLCAAPGDVYAAQKVWSPGSRASLIVEERTLAEYVDERTWGVASLVAQTSMSPALAAGLSAVFRAFRSECSTLELQTLLGEFFDLAAPELFGRTPRTSSPRGEAKLAERIRERLDRDQTEPMNLAELAREVGLSRFGTLRAFKRHYGVPPHAYRLSMRLGLACSALRRGQKPAEVAVLHGFVDQSHLTRHFRQRFGLTPAEYVRAGARRASAT
jgi:AraC-like DNA-binding protein